MKASHSCSGGRVLTSEARDHRRPAIEWKPFIVFLLVLLGDPSGAISSVSEQCAVPFACVMGIGYTSLPRCTSRELRSALRIFDYARFKIVRHRGLIPAEDLLQLALLADGDGWGNWCGINAAVRPVAQREGHANPPFRLNTAAVE